MNYKNGLDVSSTYTHIIGARFNNTLISSPSEFREICLFY